MVLAVVLAPSWLGQAVGQVLAVLGPVELEEADQEQQDHQVLLVVAAASSWKFPWCSQFASQKHLLYLDWTLSVLYLLEHAGMGSFGAEHPCNASTSAIARQA
jgi:hypothetical protein